MRDCGREERKTKKQKLDGEQEKPMQKKRKKNKKQKREWLCYMYNHHDADVQSIVMYLSFPFVMHEVVERSTDGRELFLQVFQDGAYMVICLQFVDSISVRVVFVGTVVTGEAREDNILRLAARFNASFISVPHFSSLVVQEEGRLADCLKRDVCVGCPVIVNHVNYAAVLDVVLKGSQKTFVTFEVSTCWTFCSGASSRLVRWLVWQTAKAEICEYYTVRLLGPFKRGNKVAWVGCNVIMYCVKPCCWRSQSIKKPTLPVQNVSDLYHEMAENWEDVAGWLVERGTHHAGISGAVAGREQEIAQDRILRARFALMTYLPSECWLV